MTLQLQSLLGLAVLPLLAYLLSERRSALAWRPTLRLVAAGVALQLVIAGLLLNVPMLRAAFAYPAAAVEALMTATAAGMRLVFGYLAGGPTPFAVTAPQNGFVLAFQALPLVLIVSVLSKLLYHWGVLPRLVAAVAAVLRRTLGVGGPVGTSAAANVFVGMVEAPLLVRPYLASMTRSELFATMAVGMAGVAGTVLGLYASVLKATLPDAAGHLVVASVISVPAALVIAALMVPEDPYRVSGASAVDALPPLGSLEQADAPSSSMDAITQGTREGVDLLVSITAMLIVAVALVTLVDMILAAVFVPLGIDVRLAGVLGMAFAPMAFLIGIPWAECAAAGGLLGVKTVLNEFLAYLQMAALPPEALSPRSRLLMTYALCGFANLGSLGIMIGGLVAMVPSRRAEIVSLGVRTVVAGTLATLMTAAVVGVLTPG
jgi:CNT family concentrative nucleoside transporter